MWRFLLRSERGTSGSPEFNQEPLKVFVTWFSDWLILSFISLSLFLCFLSCLMKQEIIGTDGVGSDVEHFLLISGDEQERSESSERLQTGYQQQDEPRLHPADWNRPREEDGGLGFDDQVNKSGGGVRRGRSRCLILGEISCCSAE